jgi:hypothetical protein
VRGGEIARTVEAARRALLRVIDARADGTSVAEGVAEGDMPVRVRDELVGDELRVTPRLSLLRLRCPLRARLDGGQRVSHAITFVSASAGSGKTWRVVDEVLRALDDGSLRPEGLIATTFSRRAAESLRTRLRGALLAQGRVEDALALDDARIGTVHGLCAEIVRQHSLELGLRTDLQVVDDETTTAMLRALLGEIVPVESLDAADALRTRLVDFDLIETAAAVVRAGRGERSRRRGPAHLGPAQRRGARTDPRPRGPRRRARSRAGPLPSTLPRRRAVRRRHRQPAPRP